MTLDHLQDWVGKEDIAEDHVSIRDAQRLAAVLGRPLSPVAGDELPACWHWTLFQPLVPGHLLRPDGHPSRDEFLPPVPLPRRMFTGIEVESERPLRLGEQVQRRSVIDSVVPKEGRNGQLVFVTLRHTLESSGGGRVVERHSFVFRDAASAKRTEGRSEAPAHGEGRSERREPAWQRVLMADAVMVFRFVAAAFNAHRIHYDLDYATGVEGYAERLVPGRLVALLMLEELHARGARPVAKFSFRARQPLWVGQSLTIEGISEKDGCSELRAVTEAGEVTVEASATTRSADGGELPSRA